ncbi:type III restriction-modification system endonuclease [Simiaoa sp.]|uniref:type III restriction-modification system endonuclease n=1 Tax=Simiaoa sp. TaxID=2944202 RepID=UPI003F803CC4
MKLQFKHQKFQVDAAKAVVDVFAGQPYLTSSYKMDRGVGDYQISMMSNGDFTGWGNQPVIPELDDQMILDHIRTIQRDNQIAPSEKLEGKYNLTIEMETGVGKTYTYIKTMYELNKHYGWSKFIIVVPSIAIREGVYKTFQVTQEHFAEEYGRKINYFIYNSSKLTEIDRFASDNSINVMIINSQAFNAKGRDARRIHMKLDEFRSRRPIDIIAATHPIVVIDEPQSVEGKQTKKNLKEFHPLMMLRYSATHKKDSIYNMVYRLDAMEAYNKKLVKKIAVKGIQETGTNATDSYVYLEGINLSDTDPTATIQFHVKGTAGLKTVSKRAGIGLNLYTASGELEEYHNNFIVKNIDGRDDSIEFLNGIKLYAGDVIGRVSEEQFRRIQIRETILSHIERERQLFYKGIKVLSLFFIDEVDHYRKYDEAGRPQNGIFADMFEQEYVDVVKNLQLREGEREYGRYLQSIHAEKTHAGYFSVDRKGHMVNSKLGRVDAISDDADAYDLIMKNKELLLERDPGKSPVRFIFSHSALKEGWDNPNVFQICTLKQSSSDIRKRQEVGRGMRLCVNEDGERMDENALRADVHNVNVLTIIASESYDQFAKGLQTEIAEAVSDRPRQVTVDLFENALVHDKDGNEEIVDASMARRIIYYMTRLGYLDENDHLTEIFYRDKEDGKVSFGIALDSYRRDFLNILNCIYDATRMRPENARRYDVELRLDAEKLAMLEFKNLWEQINIRTAYAVDFDTEELVRKAIAALNLKLHVPKIFFRLEYGVMTEIRSKEELIEGTAFKKKESESYDEHPMPVNTSVKYDLIGKLVDETELTRKTIIHILTGMKETVFKQFQDNPEEFIIQAAEIINDEKAAVIIEHITYHILDDKYDTEILENAVIKGKLDVNAMKTEKHVYDHVVYDSENERRFVEELEASQEVAVYVKLPRRFYISTPVGNYTPDWAIAFKKGTVKHIYFVAETKGSADTGGLRGIEQAKINCAKEHFKAISGENVTYDVVDNYQKLLEMARG